jgi:AraC family transcriptional regulator, transcriptional activator of pobA
MVPTTNSLRQNGFTTYIVESHGAPIQYQGRDAFYKMLFIFGIGEIEYGDTVYHINGPVLWFTNPAVSWRLSLSKAHHPTYVCAFSNGFLDSGCLSWSEHCESYFESTPVLHLSVEQETFVRAIFCRMVDEQQSAYAFKEELIQNQLCVLKHMALRMTAARESVCSGLSASPSCAVLLELVELGFPAAAQALHFN